MYSIKLLIALVTLYTSAAVKVDYGGHMVIRVVPQTQQQLDYLRHLETTGVDFWLGPTLVNRSCDIRVDQLSYPLITQSLDELDLSHDIFIDDVGRLIEEEELQIALRRRLTSDKIFDLANYHTLDEITGFLNQLATDYPNFIQNQIIGRTQEGRDLIATTIGAGSNPNKPVLFFECAIHAREWISPATCTWMINQLVTQYGNDTDVTSLSNYFDWIFIVVTNPDGYAYSWTRDRNWRKNRSTGDPICQGVDLNRNFPIGFGATGSSASPCAENYKGTAPWSELESQAIRDLLAAYRGRIRAAISVHSYAQYWMCPYSYQNTLPADYAQMMRVMEVSVAALRNTFGTLYTYGTSAMVNYLAGGVTSDYYYDTEGILHSYILELRDRGNWGFSLPANQIIPTAQETWNGIKVMADEIMKGV